MRKSSLIIGSIILVMIFVSNLYSSEKLHTLKVLRGWSPVAEFKVEAANTDKERARGLMFRKKLTKDRGMWFIFHEDENNPFWMKDTYISLDIIFVDNNTNIVSISENAQPMSIKPIYSQSKYRYVLEVPAGTVKKYGIKLKDRCRFQTVY